MKEHASYVFSAYSSILALPEEKILQVGNQFKNGYPIPSFDEDLLINLCGDAQKLFEKENNIIELEGDTIVIGDIHGSIHDLLRILKYISTTSANILFLGDYVDRGFFSLECITLLFAYKVMYPNTFYFIRGNHEFDSMCSNYGFKKEILNYHNPKKKLKLVTGPNVNENEKHESSSKRSKSTVSKDDNLSNEILCDSYYANHINMNCHKYTEKLYLAFMEAFAYLPICAIVNETSLCIHGGISQKFDKIDKIRKKIQRPIHNFDENKLLCDVIWGDPSHEETSSQLFYDNPRGRGKFFTGMALSSFLKGNNLKRIIRAHECVINGIEESFKEKCITVFSASSYDRPNGNRSGILKISIQGDKISPVIFDPLDRLDKSDTIYYKVQAFQKETTRPMFNVRNTRIRSSFSSINGQLPNIHLQTSDLKISGNKSQDFLLSNSLSPFKRSIVNKKSKNQSIFNCKKLCYDCSFNTCVKKKVTIIENPAHFDDLQREEEEIEVNENANEIQTETVAVVDQKADN